MPFVSTTNAASPLGCGCYLCSDTNGTTSADFECGIAETQPLWMHPQVLPAEQSLDIPEKLGPAFKGNMEVARSFEI